MMMMICGVADQKCHFLWRKTIETRGMNGTQKKSRPVVHFPFRMVRGARQRKFFTHTHTSNTKVKESTICTLKAGLLKRFRDVTSKKKKRSSRVRERQTRNDTMSQMHVHTPRSIYKANGRDDPVKMIGCWTLLLHERSSADTPSTFVSHDVVRAHVWYSWEDWHWSLCLDDEGPDRRAPSTSELYRCQRQLLHQFLCFSDDNSLLPKGDYLLFLCSKTPCSRKSLVRATRRSQTTSTYQTCALTMLWEFHWELGSNKPGVVTPESLGIHTLVTHRTHHWARRAVKAVQPSQSDRQCTGSPTAAEDRETPKG